MRTSHPSSFAILSVTLLASLSGCGDDPIAPGPLPDASPDVAPPVDMPVTMEDAADEPLPPVDVPLFLDVPEKPDVPVADDRPTPSDAPPGSCGTIPGQVRTHATAMGTMGWGALNRSRGMMMYGCAGATRPQDCLAMHPEASDMNIGATRSALRGAHLRVLYSATTASNYWTRSSADGRFVGRGIRVHDMTRDVEITATGAQYDPAFFPDNSGFIYQPGGRLCPMSILTTGTPTSFPITGTSSRCAGSSVGLYEHLGVSLNGSDYWATAAGTAAFDDGGHRATLTDPRRNENWTATASTPLTLMTNTGSGFTAVTSRSVRTPFQGDAVISPSSLMLVTRFVNEAGAYQGYILNQLTATRMGSAVTASITELARYCFQGAKPAFSFDERYITFHHYIGGGPHVEEDARELGFTGADDPGFAQYRTRGASNVYVLDLVTGVNTRITTMGPGQYALFPHFRSDGWNYFLVRTLDTAREHVIASDAAFVLPR